MLGNPQPVERRQFGRRQTFLHGVIRPGGRSSITCIVRNTSAEGALLEVAQACWLPFRFRLIIEATRFEADCEVVRRTEATVGVRFV